MALWLPASAIVLVLCALALLCASYWLAARERWLFAALVVAAVALLLRGYAATDRALNPWDERFHALVAKNLIDTPLVPTLYADPVLPYDYRDWYSNHVWLHKPPLTLWLQAASMRVLGISEIPLRLPSLVFATAAVLVTFAIGRALFSPWVGLVAAAFHAVSGFLVDLSAGRRASDHVDTLFIFILALGLYGALVADKRWPRLVGIVLGTACGFAYLTRSLPALLLLPIWCLVRVQVSRRPGVVRELATAGFVTLLIAIPWTLYTRFQFPLEAQHEGRYAWRHVSEVLETHGGPPWRYIADMPRHFGELIYVPLVVAIASAVRGSASPARRAMLLWIAVPYALFSMMATKMPAYIALAAPALFLIQADVWVALRRRWLAEPRAGRKALLLAALVLLTISPVRHLLSPTGPLERREADPQWTRDLREMNQVIGQERAVVFNVPSPIEAMFYTPYVAYDHFPTWEQVESLIGRGYSVYFYIPRTPIAGPSITRIREVQDLSH